MRPHRLQRRGLTVALAGLALIVSSFMVLAMGGEPPGLAQQDREVLEAVLKDFLSPNNPLYQNDERDLRPPSRPARIVLHRLAGGVAGEEILKDQKMITAELAASWRRRNSGDRIPLKTLGIESKAFIIIDADQLNEEALRTKKLFWELFWERYPEVVGCAEVSLPGYTRGATAAVAEFRVSRGEYHPVLYLVRLAKSGGRWNVAWRHREIW
jgi:hypothetical protein